MKIFKDKRTFDQISIDFLADRAIDLCKATMSGYRTKVKDFSAWLKENDMSHIPLRKITSETISKYFVYLSVERDLDKVTVEKYFIHLRKLWQYAQKRDIVHMIPFDLITLPKKKVDCSPAVIDTKDLTLLLKAIKEDDKQLFLACMMIFYCFIRPGSELRLMRVKDIDIEHGLIKVPQIIAKNRSTEVVTMPVQLVELCKEYKLHEQPLEYYVFGKYKTPGTRPLSINSFRVKFNSYRDSLGLSKSYKFYSLKHTGASILHTSGLPMRELMDQLRHKRLDATQRYVKRHVGSVSERVRMSFPSPI